MFLKTEETFHDQFSQDDFSVDAFLQSYSGTYTLEGLRDALTIHLTSLEKQMIDIVNSESDTILILSSSLNGLDEKIEKLQSSLEQLKEEIMAIMHVLKENMESIKTLLEIKKQTVNEKENYIHQIQALNCCEKIKKILDNDNIKRPIASIILLRAVDQFVLQETHLNHCDKNMISPMEDSELSQVKHLVFDNFRETFLDSLKNKNKEEITSCLQMGVFLNSQRETENIIRKEILSPKFSDVISDRALKKNSKGLAGLYDDVLAIIENNMNLLLEIIYSDKGQYGFHTYNLFVNCIWISIDEKLKVNLTSIYAPGNPSVFQGNFIQTMKFIDRLCDKFGNGSNSSILHTEESFQNHLKRWNLPVYFQIRFNEIVTAYELVLADESTLYLSEESDFKLKATKSCFDSIVKCLTPTIFIVQIVHKFWKLILQILSRYYTWISEQLKIVSVGSSDDIQKYESKIQLLVSLYVDINSLIDKLPKLNLTDVPIDIRLLATENLTEFGKKFTNKLKDIEGALNNVISSVSIAAMEQVSHIPRLYRKTNRSIPTEPAPYVNLILTPPNSFYSKYGKIFSKDTIDSLMKSIYAKISDEYQVIVKKNLTQVRKTEDSLRRLKKSKQQTPDSGVVSDDQKIRIQLQLDVTHYCKEIQKVANVDIEPLQILIKEASK